MSCWGLVSVADESPFVADLWDRSRSVLMLEGGLFDEEVRPLLV